MLVITGIDTDIGKTIISAWLCVHSGLPYWKPIQTGTLGEAMTKDSYRVHALSSASIVPEYCTYKTPCSPHEASALEHEIIDVQNIKLPEQPTIIEGIGGVCVPITNDILFIDILAMWNIPTLVVSSSRLGAINHTLLTIYALQKQSIPVLGIIVNGIYNPYTHNAIESHADVPILKYIPYMECIDNATLRAIPLPKALKTYVDKLQER